MCEQVGTHSRTGAEARVERKYQLLEDSGQSLVWVMWELGCGGVMLCTKTPKLAGLGSDWMSLFCLQVLSVSLGRWTGGVLRMERTS